MKKLLNNKDIENLIIKCLDEVCDLNNIKHVDNNISIYGEDGILDSIMLVHLISKIEEIFISECDISITLVNEKTFSRKKSPFKDISSISSFIKEILDNE